MKNQFSYWQKIRQQSPVSLVHTFWMPSSVRMSSGKILFNPQTSKTKEISFALSLGKLFLFNKKPISY